MIKNCTAIVIKHREWGERDLLISLFSEEGERINAIVKGAGSGNSKRKGHLESMNIIRGTLYKSREHNYLQTAECVKNHRTLKEDLGRILHMQVLMEVVEQSTLPENPDPELYTLLKSTLEHLDQKNVCSLGAEIGLVKWAETLGLLPSFKNCGSCYKDLSEGARWDHEKQLVLCSMCAKSTAEPLDLKYRKALEFFKIAPFSECTKILFKDEEFETLGRLIPYLLRTHLERPLKSLSLLPMSTHKPLPIQP